MRSLLSLKSLFVKTLFWGSKREKNNEIQLLLDMNFSQQF